MDDDFGVGLFVGVICTAFVFILIVLFIAIHYEEKQNEIILRPNGTWECSATEETPETDLTCRFPTTQHG